MTEYLYLIKCNDRFYKIGKATNMQERMSQLQTGNPYKLCLIAAYGFPNATVVERCLHQRFVNARTNGEWFGLSDKDLEDFIQLCEMLGGILVKVENEKKHVERGRPKSNEFRMEFLKDVDRVRAFLKKSSGSERQYIKMGTIEEVYKMGGYWKVRCLEYCQKTGYQMKLAGT
jgi:hypothetical protein